MLGDCVDRGTGSIKILLDIMSDDRFIMLRGNHEQMMIEALQGLEEGRSDFYLWYYNGGRETHSELMDYDLPTQRKVFNYLKKLPLILHYKDVVMTHAGYDFAFEKNILEGDFDYDNLLWDRNHIDSDSYPMGAKVQVHGHTPTCTIEKRCKDVLEYSEDKFSIDCGTCYTGRLGVIDLDTFESFTITKK